jgi:hypothetical protein
LVWVAGGRDRVQSLLDRVRTPRRRAVTVTHALGLVVAAYYGVLAVLAFTEEALWDRLVWHDHPQLFGDSAPGFTADSVVAAIVVALLTVPQATHYLLDRWIWRVGPDNPALAHQLGFSRRDPIS